MKIDIVNIGFLFVFIGVLLILVSTLPQPKAKTDSKFFVGGIFGFMPFGFGNDKTMVYVGIGLTVLLFFLMLALKLRMV